MLLGSPLSPRYRSPALKKTDSIFVAGHRGLAGGAIYRELQQAGYTNLLTRTRAEVDLRQRDSVRAFFAEQRPQVVVVAAAKVGGIKANNDFPVDFLADNLAIQTNLLTASHLVGVDWLLFLGSTCIYPRDASQPLREDSLMTGPLEPTNE